MFVPGKPFQPSLMFVGEARSLPWSGAPERSFTRVGSGLTRKRKTRLEKLAVHKHSSLLRKSVNYGRKIFYSTGLIDACPLREAPILTAFFISRHFFQVVKLSDVVKQVPMPGNTNVGEGSVQLTSSLR